jgi:hypothetical protein
VSIAAAFRPEVWRGRRTAPTREGPRNASNNKAHEPTSGRSTHYASGHLIRVFRGIGHIFSSPYPFHWRSCSLVALAAVRYLFICAKHLFVAAIADGDVAGSAAQCGRKRLSAEGNKARPGAGRRAWPGPKSAERIKHRPLFALRVGEMLLEETHFCLSHTIGPISLSRSDLLPGFCPVTPEICSFEPNLRRAPSNAAGGER